MSLKWISRAALAAALASAAACVSVPTYESVTADVPGADVRFLKGYDAQGAYGVSGMQEYSVAPDEYCDGIKQIAALTWTDGEVKTARLRADETVYLWAVTVYIGGGGQSATQCRNLVRFTPRAGHAYDIRQTSLNGSPSCTLTITDTTTGGPAEDAEIVRLMLCRQRPRTG